VQHIAYWKCIISDETDERGMYDYFATHALVPYRVVHQTQKYCDFSTKANSRSSECNATTDGVKPNDEDMH
jgi:serine carboxypeptidase-like clade 2